MAPTFPDPWTHHNCVIWEKVRLISDEGYFSNVWECRHKVDNFSYAIKQVSLQRMFKVCNDLDRIVQEAQILLQLSNVEPLKRRHIVDYRTSWFAGPSGLIAVEDIKCPGSDSTVELPDDQFLLIQMELCDSSLKQWLTQSSPQIRQDKLVMKDMMNQIATGLEVIHAEGIIHRDLKPDNILCKKGTWKIGDFGLSKILSAGEMTMSHVGQLTYRSPEMLNSTSEYDKKTDVFSLGLIFLEILKPLQRRIAVFCELQGNLTWRLPGGPPPRPAEEILRILIGQEHPAESKILEEMLAVDPTKRLDSSQLCLRLSANSNPTRSAVTGANTGDLPGSTDCLDQLRTLDASVLMLAPSSPTAPTPTPSTTTINPQTTIQTPQLLSGCKISPTEGVNNPHTYNQTNDNLDQVNPHSLERVQTPLIPCPCHQDNNCKEYYSYILSNSKTFVQNFVHTYLQLEEAAAESATHSNFNWSIVRRWINNFQRNSVQERRRRVRQSCRVQGFGIKMVRRPVARAGTMCFLAYQDQFFNQTRAVIQSNRVLICEDAVNRTRNYVEVLLKTPHHDQITLNDGDFLLLAITRGKSDKKVKLRNRLTDETHYTKDLFGVPHIYQFKRWDENPAYLNKEESKLYNLGKRYKTRLPFLWECEDQEYSSWWARYSTHVHQLTEEVLDSLCHIYSPTKTGGQLYPNSPFLRSMGPLLTLQFPIVFGTTEGASNYSGREFEMIQLLTDEVHPPPLVLVWGPQGIGKTEFVLQYCHKFSREQNGNVIWLQGDTEQTLLDSGNKLSQKCIPNSPPCIKSVTFLDIILNTIITTNHAVPTVLIVDNVSQETAHFTTRLHQIHKTVLVLATSTNKNVLGSAAKLKELKGLDDVAVSQILKMSFGLAFNAGDVSSLNQLLQGHPRSIQQVVSLIQQEVCPSIRSTEAMEEGGTGEGEEGGIRQILSWITGDRHRLQVVSDHITNYIASCATERRFRHTIMDKKQYISSPLSNPWIDDLVFGSSLPVVDESLKLLVEHFAPNQVSVEKSKYYDLSCQHLVLLTGFRKVSNVESARSFAANFGTLLGANCVLVHEQPHKSFMSRMTKLGVEFGTPFSLVKDVANQFNVPECMAKLFTDTVGALGTSVNAKLVLFAIPVDIRDQLQEATARILVGVMDNQQDRVVICVNQTVIKYSRVFVELDLWDNALSLSKEEAHLETQHTGEGHSHIHSELPPENSEESMPCVPCAQISYHQKHWKLVKERLANYASHKSKEVMNSSTTFHKILEKLQNLGEVGQLSVEILETLSYFELEGVDGDFLRELYPDRSDTAMNVGVELLKSYGVIRISTDYTITVEQDVQEEMRNRIELNGTEESLLGKVTQSISKMGSVRPPMVKYGWCLYSHCAKYENFVKEWAAVLPSVLSGMQVWTCFSEVEILNLTQKTYEVFKCIFGPIDLRTLEVEVEVGNAFRHKFETTQAIQRLRGVETKLDSMSIGETDCTDSARVRAKTELSLARTLFGHKGDKEWEETLNLYKSVLAYRQRVAGRKEDDLETISIKVDMADILMGQKEYAETSELLKEIVDWRTSYLGNDHVDTIRGQCYLVGCFCEMKRYNEAHELLKDSIRSVAEVADYELGIRRNWLLEYVMQLANNN